MAERTMALACRADGLLRRLRPKAHYPGLNATVYEEEPISEITVDEALDFVKRSGNRLRYKATVDGWEPPHWQQAIAGENGIVRAATAPPLWDGSDFVRVEYRGRVEISVVDLETDRR